MQEELWQNITDNISDAILVQDKDGNIIYVNSAAQDLFGYSLAEGLTFNSYQLYEDGITDVHVFGQLMKTKRMVTLVQVVTRKDMTHTNPLLVTQTPIFDEAGNVKYAIEVLRDINVLNRMYNNALRQTTHREHRNYHGSTIKRSRPSRTMIASGEAMKELLRLADFVADSAAPVLIQGESGTGKELLAEYIHKNSARGGGDMVAINCAALPEGLLESELFGYEKGAFTGTTSNGKQGLIEMANGGTLLLDEVDALPLPLQAKLLRVLEMGQVRRLGAVKSNYIDFRLISASNADLSEAIREKRFRVDLYHRLSTIPLTIPPLRERVDEIRPLCEHFLEVYTHKYQRQKRLSETVIQRLEAYAWPGNIRELRNLVERIVLMTDSNVEMVDDIPSAIFLAEDPPMRVALQEKSRPHWLEQPENGQPPFDQSKTLKENVRAYERWVIEQSIKRHGSLAKAVRMLGADKSTIIRKRRSE